MVKMFCRKTQLSTHRLTLTKCQRWKVALCLLLGCCRHQLWIWSTSPLRFNSVGGNCIPAHIHAHTQTLVYTSPQHGHTSTLLHALLKVLVKSQWFNPAKHSERLKSFQRVAESLLQLPQWGNQQGWAEGIMRILYTPFTLECILTHVMLQMESHFTMASSHCKKRNVVHGSFLYISFSCKDADFRCFRKYLMWMRQNSSNRWKNIHSVKKN